MYASNTGFRIFPPPFDSQLIHSPTPEIAGIALVIPGFAICILALKALGTSWPGKVFGTDFGAGSGEDLAISRRVSHPEAAFMRSF